MTISSYMIVEQANENEYVRDTNIFLHDRTESVFKLRNIKNQCVDLFSSLIECFGDLAVQSILQIIQNLLDKQIIVEEKEVSTAEKDQQQIKEGKDPEDATQTITENKQLKFEEFTYISEDSNHQWKRVDVAMLLLGIFNEDI